MTEFFQPLLIGTLAGAIFGALLMRVWGTSKTHSERAASAAERARLEATVAGANQRLIELRTELDHRNTTLAEREHTYLAVHSELSGLKERLRSQEEELQRLLVAREDLSQAFKALSSEALKSNNQAFLDLARTTLEKFQEGAKVDLERRQQNIDEMVKPLKESLQKVDLKLEDLERQRIASSATLSEHLRNVSATQVALRDETANLVKALRTPNVRGRWGEIQLKRVVEIAGMLEYCDFMTQESSSNEEGRLRPDMIVRLPNQKNIVVDSKAPLKGYLEALEAPTDEIRTQKLRDHARQIRNHIAQLSQKAYWEQFSPSPEFVVLFLPGETFFSAALEQDPSLIEEGTEQRVILATPTTLIALLRAVAYGWRQEKLAENAQIVAKHAKELYARTAKLAGSFVKLKNGLDTTISAYNEAVGSFEGRLFVTVRKFQELGIGNEGSIPELDVVEKQTRQPNFERLIGSETVTTEEVHMISVQIDSSTPIDVSTASGESLIPVEREVASGGIKQTP
jgi:DNA recombination protein RmuC